MAANHARGSWVRSRQTGTVRRPTGSRQGPPRRRRRDRRRRRSVVSRRGQYRHRCGQSAAYPATMTLTTAGAANPRTVRPDRIPAPLFARTADGEMARAKEKMASARDGGTPTPRVRNGRPGPGPAFSYQALPTLITAAVPESVVSDAVIATFICPTSPRAE